MRPALWTALLVAVTLAAVTPAAQLPTFTADIDLVSVGVTVTDRRGNHITDLTLEDFEIVEDGRAQQVAYFARGVDQDAGPALHVGLLFDTSSSMVRDIDLARTAAIRFLNTLTEAVDMTLVDFDTEIRLAKYGQLDFPRLVERIRSRRPRGGTAMYDALGLYLNGAVENDGRTVLVLFTDGGDTRSSLGLSDLMTLIRASDVTVHAVGLVANRSSRTRLDQRARLDRIAETSGGRAFFPMTMRDVEAAYDTIVGQIRAQYTLGYSSTSTDEDGRWRDVEIRITRPDGADLRVRSRAGYFAPYRASEPVR